MGRKTDKIKKEIEDFMKAALLSIGNELLLGKTINTNFAFIGKSLAKIGIYLDKEITIPDTEKAISESLDLLWKNYDLVLTTGGLGPTKDDITKKTIADFFGKALFFDYKVWENVQFLFLKKKRKMPNLNRNQALVPQDFVAIENKMGTAPGLAYHKDNKFLFMMPGVPKEMEYLMTEHILNILKKAFKLPKIDITTIHTKGIAESAIAELIDDIVVEEPVRLAFLPQTGRVDLRVYGTNPVKNNKVVEEIKERLHHKIWGENVSSPGELIHQKFLEEGFTLSLAESCTGGMVQEILTSFSGASKYFLGGIVSYSNQAKINLLKVQENTLNKYGAVSEETAIEMAQGVKKIFKSDFSASVTGIAGPDGGTFEKPVGTVFISVANNDKTMTKKFVFSGNRKRIRQMSAENVFFMLMDLLKKSGNK